MRDLLTCVRSIIYTDLDILINCYKRASLALQHVNAKPYVEFHLAISVHHGLVFYIIKRYERAILDQERE